ncbi:unnamed protein product, partial [Symbiodinium sp. KB8]
MDTSPSSPVSTLEANEDVAVDTDASASAWTLQELEQQAKDLASTEEPEQAKDSTLIQEDMAIDTDASTSASTEPEQQAEATTSVQEDMASTSASTEELEQEAEETTSIQEKVAVDTAASTSASTEELEQEAEATTSIQENVAVDTAASTSASTEELEQEAEATTSIQDVETNAAQAEETATTTLVQEAKPPPAAPPPAKAKAQGVPEPRLAHLAAEAGAKLESELQADFNRAHEASGKYKAAQTEIAKELKALSNGTQNLQAQIPAEHDPLLTKIEKVLQTTVQPADQDKDSAEAGTTTLPGPK